MVCPNPTRITKAAALVRVLILYEVKNYRLRDEHTPIRIVTIKTIPAVDFKNFLTLFIIPVTSHH